MLVTPREYLGGIHGFQVPLMLPVFYRICSLSIVLLLQERKIEDPCRITPKYASAIFKIDCEHKVKHEFG